MNNNAVGCKCSPSIFALNKFHFRIQTSIQVYNLHFRSLSNISSAKTENQIMVLSPLQRYFSIPAEASGAPDERREKASVRVLSEDKSWSTEDQNLRQMPILLHGKSRPGAKRKTGVQTLVFVWRLRHEVSQDLRHRPGTHRGSR